MKTEESQPHSTIITATLPNEVLDDLHQLAQDRNLTLSAALQESITTRKFINDVMMKRGKLLIEKASGEVRQIVFRKSYRQGREED